MGATLDDGVLSNIYNEATTSILTLSLREVEFLFLYIYIGSILPQLVMILPCVTSCVSLQETLFIIFNSIVPSACQCGVVGPLVTHSQMVTHRKKIVT
jgi:hypothetical protein